MSIFYTSGYKYQLTRNYIYKTAIKPDHSIITEYIQLGRNGKILIRKGYAWDGPSGPTIDTKNFMRGSLVHDALYQLMRYRELPLSCRKAADKELHKICVEDGMCKARAWWVYQAVSWFAGSAALPSHKKKELKAP